MKALVATLSSCRYPWKTRVCVIQNSTATEPSGDRPMTDSRVHTSFLRFFFFYICCFCFFFFKCPVDRDFVRYGLEHWGSDQMGVNKTRRFLLEWLSFTHRYIPVGLLEVLPQRINERPLPYVSAVGCMNTHDISISIYIYVYIRYCSQILTDWGWKYVQVT